MRRIGTLVYIILSFITVNSCGKPAPMDYSNCFPLAIGNRWAYKGTDGIERFHEITGTKTIDDVAYCVLTISKTGLGNENREEYYALHPEGVIQYHKDSKVPQQFYLKFPLKKAQQWNNGTFGCVVEGEETIKVPAGHFRCVKIRSGFYHFTYWRWYAPNVGMVKWKFKGLMNPEGSKANVECELKGYSLK